MAVQTVSPDLALRQMLLVPAPHSRGAHGEEIDSVVVIPRPAGQRGAPLVVTPCVRCGEMGLMRRAKPDVPWRTSGVPFGLEGGVCRACYDALRVRRDRLVRQETRRKAVAARATVGRLAMVHGAAGREDYHPAADEPRNLAAALRIGREAHRSWGLACVEPDEFALWHVSAVWAQERTGETAELRTFCADSDDQAWCAAHQDAGTCAFATAATAQRATLAFVPARPLPMLLPAYV